MLSRKNGFVLCCITAAMLHQSTVQCRQHNTQKKESQKSMANNIPPSSTAWLTEVKELIDGKSGQNKVPGTSLILSWEAMPTNAPSLARQINALAPILVSTYVPMEIDFAQAYPEAISEEFFLKPLIKHFQDGPHKVSWEKVEQDLTANLTKFFAETDFSQFAQPEELCILVKAQNKETQEVLGIIQFLITPEYEYGTVKSGLYGVLPTHKDQGIEKILMSSLFKVLPQTKRIFLHTRVTNQAALNLYQSWGFRKFEGPLPYWTDMEYISNQEEGLQKLAQTL